MSSTSATDDDDDSTTERSVTINKFFANRVKEAEQLHDRGIDLCYVYLDHDRALEVLYTAAHLRESLLGKFHADTALSYFRIASILSGYKNNYQDGLKMARRELRLSHRLLAEVVTPKGGDGNEIDDNINLVTSKEMRQQPWLMERSSCFKAVLLNVHDDISGEEKTKYYHNLLRSVALEQKGDACVASKEWETALTHYNSAMALECSAYARNLLDTADLQIKMADCLTKMNDPESAIEELKQAARKYRQVLSVDLGRSQTTLKSEDQHFVFPHSTLGDIHSRVGAIYLSQKKFDDALGEFATAFSTYEQSLGKAHRKSVEAIYDMKAVTVREMEYLREEERKQTKQFKEKKK